MDILKFLYSKASIKRKIFDIKAKIKKVVKKYFAGHFWIAYYGAYDIDPKNLVFWICVKTDNEKKLLQSNEQLKQELRNTLVEFNYPEKAIPFVYIDFESQETVNRESNGNWYYHFK